MPSIMPSPKGECGWPKPLTPGDRDALLCLKLREATERRSVLWGLLPAGIDPDFGAYQVTSPPALEGRLRVTFQAPRHSPQPGAKPEPVALLFVVDNESVPLSPSYPDLCGLLDAIERQAGKREKALAEIMEYLDGL
jgi:hypothetical protein